MKEEEVSLKEEEGTRPSEKKVHRHTIQKKCRMEKERGMRMWKVLGAASVKKMRRIRRIREKHSGLARAQRVRRR